MALESRIREMTDRDRCLKILFSKFNQPNPSMLIRDGIKVGLLNFKSESLIWISQNMVIWFELWLRNPKTFAVIFRTRIFFLRKLATCVEAWKKGDWPNYPRDRNKFVKRKVLRRKKIYFEVWTHLP